MRAYRFSRVRNCVDFLVGRYARIEPHTELREKISLKAQSIIYKAIGYLRVSYVPDWAQINLIDSGELMNNATAETSSNLNQLLQNADTDDLDVLVDYLTDKGEGRVSLDGAVCERLVACKRDSKYSFDDRDLIASEIRLFGGNTLVNMLRRVGVSYDEVVRDVASNLKVRFTKATPLVSVESDILIKILQRAVEKMSDAERDELLKAIDMKNLVGAGPAAVTAAIAAMRVGGFATYKLAAVVANAVAKFLIGRGLTFAGNATLMRALGVAMGPVGWAVTALWTVADLGSPAYRVTLPCVVQIAYMRQKALAKA
ncbi:YaaW family protein [Caballeronia sp. SBC2]|uniref:YaaW family protein n=1 Tax=Caballeronia sp. SBC2 TaxID=2705547 RepID=UPI0013EB6E72|nr:ubiquinol-cytochrome C chaperone family protein [Caballeronia sp. SBC2]